MKIVRNSREYVIFEEDLSGVAPRNIPEEWSTTHSSYWGVKTSSFGGGERPEMEFYWKLYGTDILKIYLPRLKLLTSKNYTKI